VPGTDDPTVRGPYGYGSIPPQPAPASPSRPDLVLRTTARKSHGWSIVFVGMFAFLGSTVAFVVITMLSRQDSSILGTTLVPTPPVIAAPAPSPAVVRTPPTEEAAPLRIEHDRPHRATSAAAPKQRRRVVREQNW
jgi:hypothetical protein